MCPYLSSCVNHNLNVEVILLGHPSFVGSLKLSLELLVESSWFLRLQFFD